MLVFNIKCVWINFRVEKNLVWLMDLFCYFMLVIKWGRGRLVFVFIGLLIVGFGRFGIFGFGVFRC